MAIRPTTAASLDTVTLCACVTDGAYERRYAVVVQELLELIKKWERSDDIIDP